MKTIYSALLIVGILIHFNLKSQTIDNGSFELWPTTTCPYNVAPSLWTNYTIGGLGPDQAGTCAGTVTSFLGYSHMNLVWYTGLGLLEGASQVVSGFTPGTTYSLSFYALSDQNLYSYGDPSFIDLHIDSAVVFSTPQLISGGSWTNYIVSFVATSTQHFIAFRVANGSTGTSGCVGIDNVSLETETFIQERSKDELIISPNPLSLNLTIKQFDNLKASSGQVLTFENIKIFNILGEEILMLQKELQNDKSVSFDVSALPSGLYFVRINNTIPKKFVIEGN